jgi:hypothetical protein
MSIILSLKSAANSMLGSVFRDTLKTDMGTIETEANRVATIVAGLEGMVTNAWVTGTNYAVGNFVRSPIDIRVYRCLVAGVSVTDPSADAINWVVSSAEVSTNKGVANGYASLDAGAKVPLAQLPAAVAGAMSYQGTWNAATNTPTLASGVGTKGYYYKVSVAGTTALDGNAVWSANDTAVFDGATWDILQGGITSGEVTAALGYTPISPNGSTLFEKTSSALPCLKKTAASTLSALAGTRIIVAGILVNLTVDTAVVMPALTAGTDYAVYACTDGTIRADASWIAPTGYTAANSRMIGGFHYGLVAPGTTVAGGAFATAGNGMIWVQSNVDDIAGINRYSIWDLKFRPVGADPRGMALVGGKTWVDIYLCSTNTAVNGTSKYNTNIASGTVLPIIPAAFGGNGVTTYPALTWWVANELARANQKRMMWEHEFVDGAFGVTENQSIDTTASTYPTTLRNVGYTSKYGIEQASGHQWVWGQDSNFYSEAASPAGSWKDINGNTGAAGAGRGQDYTFGTAGLTRVILGGARSGGAFSGSRASGWSSYPWYSYWNFGLRAACDHMQLA